MPHRNARLTVHARLLVVERHRAGWPQAQIAEQLGVSRGTVKKWIDRCRAEGLAGLEDRSSRPHTSPTRTSCKVEAQVLALREARRRGAVFLAAELGLVASTVGRILARHQVPTLASIDPITGEPLRQRRGGPRYERRRPGELLHVDVKKLGRVPEGGGWRRHGRSEAVRGRGNGYDLHVAGDDHSRIAYIEALADERDATCAGFRHRAAAWFHHQGVTAERVLTDNALAYRRGRNWRAVCVGLGIQRRFIKPGCPWTKGKAERLNRTLLTEFAYARPWTSNGERRDCLIFGVTGPDAPGVSRGKDHDDGRDRACAGSDRSAAARSGTRRGRSGRGRRARRPGGLLTGLTKTVLETALEAELTEHLGYDRHQAEGRDGGNSRNCEYVAARCGRPG